MAPVACRPIIKCEESGCTGSCRLSVVEYGFSAGKKPATCRICGKTFSHTAYLPNVRGKRETGVETPLPACHAAVETFLPPCLGNQAWSLGVIHHANNQEANGEDVVMEDGTEIHLAEINKKIKANDKLRKILTNMPEEYRTLIYGDSFKSKNGIVGR